MEKYERTKRSLYINKRAKLPIIKEKKRSQTHTLHSICVLNPQTSIKLSIEQKI